MNGKSKKVVEVAGTTVSVSSVSATSDWLNITLGKSVSVAKGDKVAVKTVGMTNPSTPQSTSATMELSDGSSTFDTVDGPYTIYQGGDATGTVTDKNGNKISKQLTVSVDTLNSGSFVTQSSPNGPDYAVHLGPGKYSVEIDAKGYAPTTKRVDIVNGQDNVTDFTLKKPGYINGTLSATDGSIPSGVQVDVVETSTNKVVGSNTTDSSGNYSVSVPGGTYDVFVAFGESSNYQFDYASGVSVSTDSTTVKDLTLTPVPPSGTITGTLVDPDGNPVANAKVTAADSTYTHFRTNTTDSQGQFTITAPEGTYRVRAQSASYPTASVSGVEVTAGSSTSTSLSFAAPGYIEGSVTNASGAVPGAAVVAQGDGSFYFNKTDKNGDYNISAPAGNYTVSVFTDGQSGNSSEVQVSDGATTTSDFSFEATTVKHKSVEITSGPGTGSNLGVRAEVQSGLLQVQLVNTTARPGTGVGKPPELETLGVDSTTSFEINLTVTNFSANSLLWGLDDAAWETSPNATVDNATDITITGSPVTLQATTDQPVGPLLFKDPANAGWATGKNDVADLGYNNTVYVGVFDLSSVTGEVQDTLGGVSVTTNAQRFSTPTVVNDSLRVWVAGPSERTDGSNHTGFYQATIPDSQLSEWGVDDPVSELNALYKGSDADFSVTETSNGAQIRIENIGYSAGFVEVEAQPDGSTTSSSSGGSTGTDTTRLVSNSATGRAVVDVTNVKAGEPVSLSLDVVETEAFAVDRVTVTFGTEAGGTDVEVDADPTAPPEVPAYDGNESVAGYVTVTVQNDALTEQVTNGSFRLDVGTAAAANTTVYRYHDGSWTAVNATPQDGSVVLVETPGYSTFAVTQSTATPQESTTEPTTTATTTAEPTSTTTTETEAETETTTTTTAEPTTTATTAPATTAETTTAEPTATDTPGASSPGFGVVAAVAALLAAAGLARRR